MKYNFESHLQLTKESVEALLKGQDTKEFLLNSEILNLQAIKFNLSSKINANNNEKLSRKLNEYYPILVNYLERRKDHRDQDNGLSFKDNVTNDNIINTKEKTTARLRA